MNKVSTALVATALVFLVFAAGGQTTVSEEVSETPEARTTDAEPEGATTESTGEKSPGATASAGDGAFAQAGSARASAGDGGAVARAGDVEVRAGDAAVDNGGTGAGDGDAQEADEPGVAEGNLRDGEVTLRLVGDRGTSFSGTCAVGGEEKDISGQTPERFIYRLDGRELECGIRNPGQSVLEVVVDGEGQRSRISVTGGSDIRFTVSRSGFSSSVSG